ncbi:U-box domain-containing protein 45-like [Wolffia australiana]
MVFRNMDLSESEYNFLVFGDAKLHGEMCRSLSSIVCKVLAIFPIIEASRPRSKSGIQSLCSLHVELEKAKNLLRHCSESSRLYLAITNESTLKKFEKSKQGLLMGIRGVEDIVPESITFQIMQILSELEQTMFSLDQSERELGEAVIGLLRRERNRGGDTSAELEIFHRAAMKLGITSSKAALTERRALRKLADRARAEEDWRKESIVLHILHLMKKYSKLFRSEFSDDPDSQSSGPCSPTVLDGDLFEGHVSSSGSPGQNQGKSTGVPPEELYCPISLQLMYDPVIISSGQTYERACIEKWLSEGHRTCPKTQQRLSHLSLTPNYSVKGLIASWCEQNGVAVPDNPPDPAELTQWWGPEVDSVKVNEDLALIPGEGKYHVRRLETLLSALCEGVALGEKLRAVEQIRFILRDDEDARNHMGSSGFVEALVQILREGICDGEGAMQDATAMALFNLAVDNKRNKAMILSAGIIPLLEEMIQGPSYAAASALLLNLSCLDEAKEAIGAGSAAMQLVELLQANHASAQCKADALHALYNLSTHPANTPRLLSISIVPVLHVLLTRTASTAPPEISGNASWAERSIAILANLSSIQEGKNEIMATPGLISDLATVLDAGEGAEQEQAAACLLVLCDGDDWCSHLVLQEGVIPALVSLSVSGTARAREKAQSLLASFREQRQREHSAGESSGATAVATVVDGRVLCKSKSKKLSRTLSRMWKNKSFSVYQC